MKQTKQDVVTLRHPEKGWNAPCFFFAPSTSVFEAVEDAGGQRRDPNLFINFFDKPSLKKLKYYYQLT